MVPVFNLLAFALAVILITIPGPSVLFVIGSSLALGWKGGVLTVLGTSPGRWCRWQQQRWLGHYGCQSVVLFSLVKLAGAGYLVYLGMKAIRHRRHHTREHQSLESRPLHLVGEGFVVGPAGNRQWSQQAEFS